tara:strand:- start:33 stop:317 length:285 start_codon:yes stop_codon:yes gene_type:complete
MVDYNAIAARGVAKRSEERWAKRQEIKAKFEKKIEAAASPEELKKLENEVSELECHHLHMGDKDRECRNYEDAEANDGWADMYEFLGTLISNKV